MNNVHRIKILGVTLFLLSATTVCPAGWFDVSHWKMRLKAIITAMQQRSPLKYFNNRNQKNKQKKEPILIEPILFTDHPSFDVLLKNYLNTPTVKTLSVQEYWKSYMKMLETITESENLDKKLLTARSLYEKALGKYLQNQDNEAPQEIQKRKATARLKELQFYESGKQLLKCEAYYLAQSKILRNQRQKLEELYTINEVNLYKEVNEQSKLTKDLFVKVLDQFNTYMKDKLANSRWLGIPVESISGFKVKNLYVLGLKVLPESKLYMFGDRHGDCCSFITMIAQLIKKKVIEKNSLKIKDPKVIFFLLGDFTDRGLAGAELIYFVLRFCLANPQQVFPVRGNHESVELNKVSGFELEWKTKFFGDGKQYTPQDYKDFENKISTMYNLLPVAIAIGSGNDTIFKYCLALHGIPDSRQNMKPLLKKLSKSPVGTLLYTQYNYLNGISNDCNNNTTKILNQLKIGGLKLPAREFQEVLFSWGFFNKEREPAFSLNERGPTYTAGYKYVKALLTQDWSFIYQRRKKLITIVLEAVFRGHQHIDFTRYDQFYDSYNKKSGLYGEFMDKLRKHGGCYRSWFNNQSKAKKRTISPGSVYTLSPSPNNMYGVAGKHYLPVALDTAVVVTVPKDPQNEYTIKVLNY